MAARQDQTLQIFLIIFIFLFLVAAVFAYLGWRGYSDQFQIVTGRRYIRSGPRANATNATNLPGPHRQKYRAQHESGLTAGRRPSLDSLFHPCLFPERPSKSVALKDLRRLAASPQSSRD